MLRRKSLSVLERGVSYLRNSTTRHIHSSPISSAPFVTVVPEKQAYVIERFGKHHKVLTSGMYLLIPFVDRISYILVCKEEQDQHIPTSARNILELKIVNPKVNYVTLGHQMKKLLEAIAEDGDGGDYVIDVSEEVDDGDSKTVIVRCMRRQ